MNISGLVKTSTVDFPNQLAAVIFSPGCNLDCFYCHNRALLGDTAPRLLPEDVLSFLKKRQGLLDGVVFSGGEPTLQDDLLEFVQKVHKLGYKVKLDTNGTRPAVLRRLLTEQILDYVAVDFKAPWRRYPEICDCSQLDVKAIQSSLQLLKTCKISWEVRTTVIPQLGPEDLKDMAGSLPEVPLFVLQRYLRPALCRPADRFRLEAAGYTPAELVLLAEQLRPAQPQIRVR